MQDAEACKTVRMRPLAGKRGPVVDVNLKTEELRTVQRIMRLANTATTARDEIVVGPFSHLVVQLPAQG